MKFNESFPVENVSLSEVGANHCRVFPSGVKVRGSTDSEALPSIPLSSIPDLTATRPRLSTIPSSQANARTPEFPASARAPLPPAHRKTAPNSLLESLRRSVPTSPSRLPTRLRPAQHSGKTGCWCADIAPLRRAARLPRRASPRAGCCIQLPTRSLREMDQRRKQVS